MFSVIVQCENPKAEAMALSIPKQSTTPPSGALGNTVKFFAGNPAVHVTKGVIHLLRDTETNGIVHERGKLPKLTSCLILILAVPSYILVADFITWCGAFTADMDGMRILCDASSHRYMVLANFKEQKFANEFYLHYYGKEFSSLGDEVAYPVFAKGVEFFDSKATLFPHQMEKELPTCPVCLERLDSSATGVVTLLCNHYFHCHCLRKWREDNSCPVCRYVQQPIGAKTQCHDCGNTNALWICLICGHVGCGRYENGHAFIHFQQTKHTYALELETQRVWDYTSDGYVHRLVRNQADGKLIALPDPGMSGEEDPQYLKGKGKDMGKLDALSLEYSYLLTAQLETQRDYFEKQLAMVHRQKTGKLAFMEDQYAQLLGQKIDCAKRLQTVEREKQRLKCRTNELEDKMNDILKESEFLRNVNKAMQENQVEYRKKIECLKARETEADVDKDKKIRELEEQVRDLMLYIEAKDKIEALDQKGEIKEGQVVSLSNPNVGNSTTSPKKRPRRKGRGRKR